MPEDLVPRDADVAPFSYVPIQVSETVVKLTPLRVCAHVLGTAALVLNHSSGAMTAAAS